MYIRHSSSNKTTTSKTKHKPFTLATFVADECGFRPCKVCAPIVAPEYYAAFEAAAAAEAARKKAEAA